MLWIFPTTFLKNLEKIPIFAEKWTQERKSARKTAYSIEYYSLP
jgi:hypothetical protein